MATDPLKKSLNRAHQTKIDSEMKNFGIELIDVDRAIMEHIEETVLPTLEVQGEVRTIPVIYGSAERWKSIKKDGFLRDKQGQIQLPLLVLKRNSVEGNDEIQNPLNRQETYPAVSKYSAKHKHDLFSLMTGFKRPVEQYNVTIPDYVNISYEVMVWTDFTEQMNKIVEAFQYATDTYWGDKYKFKFLSKISSFDTTSEIADQSQRIVRTTFTIDVKAYLLPEKFNNQPTTQKAFTVKKVIWDIRLDTEEEREESKFLTKTPSTGTNYRDEYYELLEQLNSSSGSFDGGATADFWPNP